MNVIYTPEEHQKAVWGEEFKNLTQREKFYDLEFIKNSYGYQSTLLKKQISKLLLDIAKDLKIDKLVDLLSSKND